MRSLVVALLLGLASTACSRPQLELVIDRRASVQERIYWHTAIAEWTTRTGYDWLVRDGECERGAMACASVIDEFEDAEVDAGYRQTGYTEPGPTIVSCLDHVEVEDEIVDLAVPLRVHELGHYAGIPHHAEDSVGIMSWDVWRSPCISSRDLDEFCTRWPCAWREPACEF